MMVNHLQTTHYHLGFICAHCEDYFTMSADAMHDHAPLIKPMAAGNNDNNREDSPPDYENNDNGNEDDEFMFEED